MKTENKYPRKILLATASDMTSRFLQAIIRTSPEFRKMPEKSHEKILKFEKTNDVFFIPESVVSILNKFPENQIVFNPHLKHQGTIYHAWVYKGSGPLQKSPVWLAICAEMIG